MVRAVERFSFLAGGHIYADNRIDRCGVSLRIVIEGASFNLDRPGQRGNTLNLEHTFMWDEIPPDADHLEGWLKSQIRHLWREAWDHEFEELLMQCAPDGADLAYCYDPHGIERNPRGRSDARPSPEAVSQERERASRRAVLVPGDQRP